ncbi:uncharacterized protein G2W53_031442 [Senna tora]|uniref:Uncharacterized protein n=1 Tax=Senna tora TaxID=362788 RepID=A0A834WDZ5_9FABA|nr:uncharacterized protein G2W53_031442 [Senna tora]
MGFIINVHECSVITYSSSPPCYSVTVVYSIEFTVVVYLGFITNLSFDSSFNTTEPEPPSLDLASPRASSSQGVVFATAMALFGTVIPVLRLHKSLPFSLPTLRFYISSSTTTLDIGGLHCNSTSTLAFLGWSHWGMKSKQREKEEGANESGRVTVLVDKAFVVAMQLGAYRKGYWEWELTCHRPFPSTQNDTLSFLQKEQYLREALCSG